MNPNLLMAGAYGIQGAASLGAGFSSYRAYQAQGDYQARMLELNAKIQEFMAADAIKRGDKAADTYNRRVSQLIGSQRASYAAQGVAVGDGSAAEVQEQTAVTGAEDAVMIRSNAWREAWGFRVQAQDLRSQAEMAKIGANFQATQSLLTGITDFASTGLKATAEYQKYADSKSPTFHGSSSLRTKQNARTFSLSEPETGYNPIWRF